MTRPSRCSLRQLLSGSPGLQVPLLIVVMVAVLLLAEDTSMVPG